MLSLTASAVACTEPDEVRLTVVVNIFPLRWLAERIGGDLVDVHMIEAEPHEEDALSKEDRSLIKSAHANLFAGNLSADLRDALDEWRAGRSPNVTADISDLERLNLQPGPADLGEDLIDGKDPHFWLDPYERMPVATDWVTNQLHSAVTFHPGLQADAEEHRQSFAARGEQVKADLAALHGELKDPILRGCGHRVIVPEHPAFWYFADRYDLEQFPVTRLLRGTLSPAQERDQEQRLAELFQAPVKPAFFYAIDKRQNDPERDLLTKLASEHRVTVGRLDSLEEEPAIIGSEGKRITDYLEAMRANARNIAREFRC